MLKKYLFIIIGTVLLLDGLILILWRKIHFGTVLPFLIGGLFLSLVIFNKKIDKFLNQKLIYQKLYKMAWGIFLAWVLSVFVFFMFISKQQFNTIPNNINAIIVLGSQVKNGKPTPPLQARLDKAIEITKTNTDIPIIVTGGIGFGNSESEASVMEKYLIDNGVKNKIIYEDKSTSTELNLKNSMILMNKNHIAVDNIAIITNDFHCLRAKLIADKLGLQETAISAPMPILTRYNSWLREYFAFGVGFILNEF